MAEQEQDRSEAATPHKLKEAQSRGQVSKSQEAIFAAILAALVLALFSVGPGIVRQELALMQHALDHASRLEWTAADTGGWLFGLLSDAVMCLLPLLLSILVAAILANIAQVGAVFSFHPVTPDFQRLNPATGFKRLFSMAILYNAGKSVLKLAVISWVLWLVLMQAFPRLFMLNRIDVHAHGGIVMGEVTPLLVKLLLVIFVLSLLDVAYTRWDFGKKMRMSRREVRDEHKNREGDPRIRSRLRQLRAEMVKQSRSMHKLPGADVLVVNPTHLAVALSYKHGEMPAPQMLAKGAGTLAAKMREIARLHDIPIVQNAPLARAMYKRLKNNEYLPEDLYPTAAKILLWVYAARDARARAQGAR